MGKSKKRRRSSSSRESYSSGDTSIPNKELLKRLKKLEKYYKRNRKARSRSASPLRRQRRSPSSARALPIRQSERERRSRSRTRQRSPSNLRSPSIRRSFSRTSPRRQRSPSVPRSAARDPCDSANAPNDSFAHSPSGMASLIEDEDASLHDAVVIHNDVQLPEDVLNILGEDPGVEQGDGGTIHSALASRWTHFITNGLTENECTKLIQKYKIPSNCPLLTPPAINPESKSIIPLNMRKKDDAYIRFQTKLGTGIAALGKGIDYILSDKENLPSTQKDVLLPCMSDAGRLLADLYHDLSMARRSFIFPYMNKETKEILEKCPPSNLLFGSDLSEKVKTAKSIQAASKDLKAVPSIHGFNKAIPKKEGGRQMKGHQIYGNLNRFRPTRPPRETGSKGQTSKETRQQPYKERYRRRK